MNRKFFILGLSTVFLASPLFADNSRGQNSKNGDQIEVEISGAKTMPTSEYMKYISRAVGPQRTKGGDGGGEGGDDERKPLTYEEKLDRTNRTLEAVNNGVIVADNIINTGAKVYELVKDNAAIIQSDVVYSQAIPKGIEDWTDLAGWTFPPSAVTYEFKLKSWGSTVAKLRFAVMFTHNGNLFGTGKYLGGVVIQPTNVEVASGYILSIKCEVPDKTVTNIGSVENPIAALQVKLTWKLTKSDSKENTVIFAIDGNGNFHEMAVDNVTKISERITKAR